MKNLILFLKLHANQNQSKNISKTFIATTLNEKNKFKNVYGYYTLAMGQIKWDELPENMASKLPRYPVPIARVGRLAVDKNYQGKGIGEFLLRNAFINVLEASEKVGAFAIVVDAKNDKAKAFYKSYDFIELQHSPLSLFLPISTIQSALNS